RERLVEEFGYQWIGNWRVYGEERIRAETAMKFAYFVALTASPDLFFSTVVYGFDNTIIA
ncbi:MAG: hypothetical protein AMK69_18885, partial [Nitrospira bacterium SG8_3]